MDADLERLSRYNERLRMGAEMEAKVRRYIRREKPGPERDIAKQHLQWMTRDLDQLEREIAALEQERRRKLKRRRMADSRVPVRFFGIEAIEPRELAAREEL